MQATDPFDTDTQRQAAEAEAANAERTRVGDLQWIMSSPKGRRWIGWLMNTAGVARPSFNNSGSITAFNEGLRAIGIKVHDDVLRHCFSNYLVMLDEARADEAKKGTSK